MASTADLRFVFNRGEIGKTALGRVDRDGLRLAAEVQENFMPIAQGPMMLRPGSKYLGDILNNSETKLVPFVFSQTDKALLELTENNLRIWIDNDPIERPAVTTSVVSSDFSSSSGWVLPVVDGATSVIQNNRLELSVTARGAKAKAQQTVSVPSGSQGVEHALRVTISAGIVYLKVGTTIGSDDLINRTALGTGTHSLAFTPTTSFTIDFENHDLALRTITGCTIESAGEVVIPTPWTADDFTQLQHIQSGDIVYIASTQKQMKIERRSKRSWSVVNYYGMLGPLRAQKPREQDISLYANVYEGNGQLFADEALFTDKHIGAMIRLFPTGQIRKTKLAAEDTFMDPIRVFGVGAERLFQLQISGTWSGHLTLQRSLDGPSTGFTDIINGSNYLPWQYNNNGNFNIDDHASFNNSIVWYRLGFKEGDYQGGVAEVQYGYGPTSGGGDVNEGRTGSGTTTFEGGTAAFVRILSLNSSTSANIEVLKPFGALTKTKDWLIGEWNDSDGYPTSVTLFDGRLWWGGKDRMWGSVSDDYENFDHDFEGDAGPISRSIGTGPVDTIVWLLSLARLMAGRGVAVSSVRSSNFDEPLTPTNFTIKDAATRGAAATSAAQVDSRGVYIHANNSQIFELVYKVEAQDYGAVDLTQFNYDIGRPGFDRLAAARAPDTRLFVVRNDGQLAVVLREQDGDVQLASWWRLVTDGLYEDVTMLPDDIEDSVYVVVNRDGVRRLEVFARRDECVGAPETKCLDSHVVYNGAATDTISGLDHLEGKVVRVWGAVSSDDATGLDLGEYTVTGGSVGQLPMNVTVAVVGLPYTAKFVSTKLAYGAGLAIGSIKRIDQISFVLFDTHAQGLSFGQDQDYLEPMPLIEDDKDVDPNYIWSQYDKKIMSLPGRWDADSRIVLQAQSPRPATVGAALLSVDTSVRVN